ncbi:MAG: HEPN domain-containing protein [Acidocella sp.]|nr:HEPN domain-containing protein [Acidocella sp.]
MPRADLDEHFLELDKLVAKINSFVPADDKYRSVEFRADLAGLLVVAIASTYETCVKEILYEHANRHHLSFGNFTLRNYERLNSRVKVNDLQKYCELFDPTIKARFKERLVTKKRCLLDRIGANIETSYEQILSWRHDFAHAGVRATTIEEATKTHMLGKRVLYIFDYAFNQP